MAMEELFRAIEDLFEAFGKSVNEGVEGIRMALFLSTMGMIISALSTLPGGDFVIEYWFMFLAIMSLADVLMIFVVAQEALEASIGYILGRAVGLLLMAWIGKIIGVSIKIYVVSYILLLVILILKVYLVFQEQRGYYRW
ncbi:hypothetical protein [Thermococcus sp. ES12]|uniref:hypothetical protein n=1 Tax=Thermococcus sp. ES12 TaxID=1638246 RepID=UPI00143142DE|nr:hypothetical protein [Thermococcus sp. ES12]NJE76926.1 hypothetical protein [Thermococcus sp. ES12]